MVTYRTRERLPFTVEKFCDGDTVQGVITCPTCAGIQRKYVRLKGIESFELRSPEGDKAKAIAQKYTTLYAGKEAELLATQNGSDKYGRVVGEVIIDGFHLTEILVTSGDAWRI